MAMTLKPSHACDTWLSLCLRPCPLASFIPSFSDPLFPTDALDECSTGLVRDAMGIICKQGPSDSSAPSTERVEVVMLAMEGNGWNSYWLL